jgi:hypothetical protein
VIYRRHLIERLTFVPLGDSPGRPGLIGALELSVDGEAFGPIRVLRCSQGVLHLVHGVAPTLPVWAHALEVREEIHDFIEDATRAWQEDIDDGS